MTRGLLLRGAALLLAMASAACATGERAAAPPVTAAPPPPVESTPPPPPPPPVDPRDPLVSRHLEQAARLEAEGDLHRAILEVKVALTIRPDDGPARAALDRLNETVERQVAERMRAGREALQREPRPRPAGSSWPRSRSIPRIAPHSTPSRARRARSRSSPTQCGRGTRWPPWPSATTATARGPR